MLYRRTLRPEMVAHLFQGQIERRKHQEHVADALSIDWVSVAKSSGQTAFRAISVSTAVSQPVLIVQGPRLNPVAVNPRTPNPF